MADFADLFHFALRFQLVQISHGRAAGYAERQIPTNSSPVLVPCFPASLRDTSNTKMTTIITKAIMNKDIYPMGLFYNILIFPAPLEATRFLMGLISFRRFGVLQFRKQRLLVRILLLAVFVVNYGFLKEVHYCLSPFSINSSTLCFASSRK